MEIKTKYNVGDLVYVVDLGKNLMDPAHREKPAQYFYQPHLIQMIEIQVYDDAIYEFYSSEEPEDIFVTEEQAQAECDRRNKKNVRDDLHDLTGTSDLIKGVIDDK